MASQETAVLKVTEQAKRMVLEARSGEEGAENLALWLEVSGVNGGSYAYDMYFQAAADASAGDTVQEIEGLTIVVPEPSVAKVRGATLDLSEDPEAGMVIINPNSPAPPQVPASFEGADLGGELAQKVMAVLEQQVNPSIAAHGGRADLVGVEGETAYLNLSGGCQGCGLATVTLSQGIEVAITETVPEITSVVDVTDHASGTDPFFEPSKK